MKYLQFIRFQNLLLLALMQLILRFGFLNKQHFTLSLTDWKYVLLVISTLCIAAGGYVINDIFDQGTDSINKPDKVFVGRLISEKTAYSLYVSLTIIGVAIGFLLANSVQKPNFAVFFIFIASILYFYATTLKQLFLVGNLLIALLAGLSIVIVGIFDLIPSTTPENQIQMISIFSLLLDYAVFAFLVHLIREIVKDLEDLHGDTTYEMKTLAIQLGIKNTTKLLFVVSLLPIGLFINYMYHYFISNNLQIVTLYSLVGILAPFVYFTVKIIRARTQSDFHHLSLVLKWIIFFGIFILPILHYNIQNHA
ncbi:geranylgeranylglycerol-phosphate geranylgeranyltransferase [Flavobacterium sp. TSSA_36]|uniref:geranylgeranylglycerol-phosphate geranylgeranyltransferase n=1 Tax=Flavobacterium sp. TSSA_36 TaxID=3447669 RepID=UPI003F391876